MPPKVQQQQQSHASAPATTRLKLPPSQIQIRENSIYIGNIPFDADPHELLAMLEKIGKVVAYKAPIDPETSKLRGFVFVEFAEHSNVDLAIKHLNNYQFGNRPLKVDYATKQDNDPKIFGAAGGSVAAGTAASTEEMWGSVCDAADAPQETARVVSQLSPEMMQTLMHDMRKMLIVNPNESQQMLARYPQMSYALLLCLVRMGHITEQEASGMLYSTQPAAPVMPPPQQTVLSAPQPMGPTLSYVSPAGVPGLPGGLSHLNVHAGNTPTQQNSSSNSPWLAPTGGGGDSPWASGARSAMPTSHTASSSLYDRSPHLLDHRPGIPGRSPATATTSSTTPAGSSSNSNADRQKLIHLVTMATDEEIQSLPADVRDQIRQLREQLGQKTTNR